MTNNLKNDVLVLDVFRTEHKYLITAVEAAKIREIVKSVLKKDSNIEQLSYLVRSLYFDSSLNNDLADTVNGEYKRKKIRLRIYDINSEFAKLELKLKEGSLQNKISLTVSRSDAIELSSGNFKILLNYKSDKAIKIYSLLKSGYKAKTIVEYQREAYVSKIGNTRVTFDRNIRATGANLDLFSDKLPLKPVSLDNNVILEIKYDGMPHPLINKLLSGKLNSRTSFSKYTNSRSIKGEIYE